MQRIVKFNEAEHVDRVVAIIILRRFEFVQKDEI